MARTAQIIVTAEKTAAPTTGVSPRYRIAHSFPNPDPADLIARTAQVVNHLGRVQGLTGDMGLLAREAMTVFSYRGDTEHLIGMADHEDVSHIFAGAVDGCELAVLVEITSHWFRFGFLASLDTGDEITDVCRVHEFWLRTGIPASHMATVAEAYRTLMAAECEDHALVDDDSIAEVLTPTPESPYLVTYTPGPAWGPAHTRP